MGYKILTPEQDNWLKENAHLPHSHLAKHLGISIHTIATKLKRWGIKRTQEQMNKNMKVINANEYPKIYDGKDRKGNPCRYIVHKPGQREKYINYLWKQAGYRICRASHLTPKDGDYFNFDLSNWYRSGNGTDNLENGISKPIRREYKKLTKEQNEWLRQNTHLTISNLASRLNVSINTIRSKFKAWGIKRTPEQIKENFKLAQYNKNYPLFYDGTDRKGNPCRYIVHGPARREKYINYLWKQSGRKLHNCTHLVPMDGNYFNFDLKNWQQRPNGTKRTGYIQPKKRRIAKKVIVTPPKVQPTQYKTLARDYSALKTVRVDAKTVIYIKPNECPEKAIEAYKQRLDKLNQKIKNVR